ncbi:MAG: sensor histidine kinase [Culicoidibacterales bacterium]
MRAKQIELFIMYSLSIIVVTAIFSFTIFFSVSYSEENRIKETLTHSQTLLLEKFNSNKTYSEIVQYINENRIDVIMWAGNGSLSPQSYAKTELVSVKQPLRIDVLEKFYADVKIPLSQEIQNTLVYSLSTLTHLNGEAIILQIVYNSLETTALLENLSTMLFFGTIVVSLFGIILGIGLTFLNMMPVIKSWKQQRAFVADASHELRTPLSIITLKSDLLLSRSKDTIYEHIGAVAIIHQECRRMHKMVEDLLFLAKRDSGVVDIVVEPFRVDKLMAELEILYAEFFEMADKELIFEGEFNGFVLGDYEKIKQVCMIIIDNALRFTDAKNYVKCTVESRGNRVIIMISNNGVPLENKEIPFLFDRFYKSDSSRVREESSGGNGLGLSIAQEIMGLHQSRIKANLVDSLTSFSFSLHKHETKKEKATPIKVTGK